MWKNVPFVLPVLCADAGPCDECGDAWQDDADACGVCDEMVCAGCLETKDARDGRRDLCAGCRRIVGGSKLQRERMHEDCDCSKQKVLKDMFVCSVCREKR